MDAHEIRRRFIAFFVARAHAQIPSASLVPEHDPSVLFTTAGMHPLVPYLLGEPHPAGKRLVNVQKCVRTQDIESIGDATHDTFFEMLGNWSLGDYFKEEAIKWSYELLTNTEEGFGLDPQRLYVTCFEGDENAPRDEESAAIWQKVGVPADRIYFLPAKNNWWSVGEDGPCGPDTEMFYDVSDRGLGTLSHEEFLAADERQDVVEIWNDVFMEYEKRGGKVVGKLTQKNVDTGAGLERLAMVLQKKRSIFETDLFTLLMEAIRSYSTKQDGKAERIVADHLRTAAFMVADGVVPSNTDRGYVLRRLLRRAVRYADMLGIPAGSLASITDSVQGIYSGVYSELAEAQIIIKETLHSEEELFRTTLVRGLKEFEKLSIDGLSGEEAFTLFSTYGFPFELTQELAREKGMEVDEAAFQTALSAHQELSRAGAEQKFKGGLAGHSEVELRYHTATHLLQQALTDVLGSTVAQMGSNITAERLRFDFSHPTKLTDEEKSRVEALINQKIAEDLPVQQVLLPRAEAERSGARHLFNEKYGDEVSIYFIGPDLERAYSKEFCGGPHVARTGELGHFKIIKEEAVAAGIRRIKAVLE